MEPQQRRAWLDSLTVNSPVCERVVKTNIIERYVDEVGDDGSLLINGRWYDRNTGTSETGSIYNTYDIQPVTPETAAQLHHRQSANYLGGVNWSRYETWELEEVISFLRGLKIREAA